METMARTLFMVHGRGKTGMTLAAQAGRGSTQLTSVVGAPH